MCIWDYVEHMGFLPILKICWRTVGLLAAIFMPCRYRYPMKKWIMKTEVRRKEYIFQKKMDKISRFQ